MGRSGCFDVDQVECAYIHCLSKFRDENGNPSTITTTSAPAITTVVNPGPPITEEDTASGLLGANFAVWVGSGSGGFVVICILIILCLCRSRNREKSKRRVIEQDYRVVATTLTNVSDSDGTTYEELCIDNPHYNRQHDIQLPSKKDRKRLPGVSNAIQDSVKRWISVDANQATANTSKSLMQTTNKPLPPIPEANKARSLERGKKELASTKLSQSIDEYTEIGSGVQRRSNVYNPLDKDSIGEKRESHGTYAMLRESTMLENIRPPIGLPPGEYFTLEKVNIEDVEVKSPSGDGEYTVLAKEEDLNNTENMRLLPIAMAARIDEESEVRPYAESALCSIEDEADSGICESGGIKNEYFILQKDTGDKNRNVDNSDYIEPVKGDKHAYMQVLPGQHGVYRKIEK